MRVYYIERTEFRRELENIQQLIIMEQKLNKTSKFWFLPVKPLDSNLFYSVLFCSHSLIIN